MRVGILALQGDFAAHARALERVGAEHVEVRVPRDLHDCAGLLLPGGESTTLLRLLEPHGLFEAIPAFHRGGGALFGTCAGAILLADEVHPSQPSFGLIDIAVERNAYGRQRESFEASAVATLRLEAPGARAEGVEVAADGVPMLFIRAPRIVRVGRSVEVLATWAGDPVLVRGKRVLACTGHPELTHSLQVHRLFVEALREPAAADRSAPRPRAAAVRG